MLVKKSQSILKLRKPMRIRVYNFSKKYSAALIRINGNHGKVKSLRGDRIYFIISGKGVFEIGGKRHAVSRGDLIFIPKKTPYNIVGKMEFFMVNSPAFRAEEDVRLD